MADVTEIGLENIDPEFTEVWDPGTSKAYFSEKLTGFISSFGSLAERTLKGEPVGKAKDNADQYLYVAAGALPKFRDGWGPFVP